MITLRIKRRKKNSKETYLQDIPYEPKGAADTVAMALREIEKGGYTDAAGVEVRPVRWECSCLQKKCGACAMLINGRPALACDARIPELARRSRNVVTLAPLSRFPVIEDLRVDRSIMYENLKALKLYMAGTAGLKSGRSRDTAYDASKCLQCGCCLEVCPNFYAGGSFYGAAAAVPASRVLTSEAPEDSRELRKLYDQHIFEGCGKSLACRDVCPAGIDLGRMLSSANGIAVWLRHAK